MKPRETCGSCKWMDDHQFGSKPSCRENGKTESSESCASKEEKRSCYANRRFFRNR